MFGRTVSSGGRFAGLLIMTLIILAALVVGLRLLRKWSSDEVHFSRDIPHSESKLHALPWRRATEEQRLVSVS